MSKRITCINERCDPKVVIFFFVRYADEKWDFVRGQLSTVDRNYGYVHYLIHSIGTHQMHHMFTKVITCNTGCTLVNIKQSLNE